MAGSPGPAGTGSSCTRRGSTVSRSLRRRWASTRPPHCYRPSCRRGRSRWRRTLRCRVPRGRSSTGSALLLYTGHARTLGSIRLAVSCCRMRQGSCFDTLRMKPSELHAETQVKEEVLKGMRLPTPSLEEQESDWELTKEVKHRRRRRRRKKKKEELQDEQVLFISITSLSTSCLRFLAMYIYMNDETSRCRISSWVQCL